MIENREQDKFCAPLQKVTILGATGSIGRSTLDVIALHPDRYQVFALSANTDIAKMTELVLAHKPKYAVMACSEAAQQLTKAVAERSDTVILGGEASLEQVAADPAVDVVMAAIVGGAGLKPTLAAAKASKRILLANKEALVMGGELFVDTVVAHGAVLLPIDSEHNAIFQCLPPGLTPKGLVSEKMKEHGIHKVLLTASGGPFLNRSQDDLKAVTPEDACRHPNWSMGRKISVDSATMMNKGLELIEACWLFNAKPDQIDVVIHPQSLVHSMVHYIDGSVLAQLGSPDMKTPIAYGLGWPERIHSGADVLDLFKAKPMTFEQPNYQQFPCLALARQAADKNGAAPIVLNAANEVAVDAFLNHRLAFVDIAKVVELALSELHSLLAPNDLTDIMSIDQQSRYLVLELIKRKLL